VSEDLRPSDPIEVPPPAETSIIGISARTATVLLVFTLVFTALMAATYFATKPAIELSARAEKMKLIGEVLPAGTYDNDLLADGVALPPVGALGLDDDSTVYRARKGGQPVALVLEAAAPDGYSGRIGLLLAVSPEGRLLALRVTQHRETPGLGDYIDPKKDKNKANPWIAQFNGKGFDEISPEQWKVKKDGGMFDAHVGSTISARAVTNASGRALAWAGDNKDKLFQLPAGGRMESKP
jgi:Na+-translocating ferredoxin:NAD+ oxidoreductase subunit G